MRIFVAGATGVLGRRVVPALVADGHTVTAVARSDAKAAGLRTQGADPARVDLFDAAAVTAAVDGHDAVINLATAIPPTSRMLAPSAYAMTDRLRTEAAGNLVDAALHGGATHYVQEALSFVYPDSGAAWISEDTRLAPPPHARSVVAAEGHADRFAAAGGTGVALRFGLFQAADSTHTVAMVPLVRRGAFMVPEPADGYRPWIHADDAATAVVAALGAPSGAYNVTENDPLTGTEHLALLRDLVGRRVYGPPAWLARGHRLRLTLRSLRVSNRRLRDRTAWRPRFDRRAMWEQVLGDEVRSDA